MVCSFEFLAKQLNLAAYYGHSNIVVHQVVCRRLLRCVRGSDTFAADRIRVGIGQVIGLVALANVEKTLYQ